ncbi:unnamed protein product [Prunus armeniaca]
MGDELELNNLTLPLKDFTVPKALDQPSCIAYLATTTTFEIKSRTIHLLPQFYGKAGDDPHIHIQDFFAVCATMHNGGISDEAIRLRLFPFSLKEGAKEWLYSLPSASITTWTILASKFLAKFFPAQKMNYIRKEIMGVQQLDGESFYEYWDQEDDATHEGGLMNKSATQAKEMFENIATNSQQFNYRRAPPKKVGFYEVSASDIGPQIANLTNLVKQLILQAQVCVVCANPGHPTESCPDLYAPVQQNQFAPQQNAPPPPPGQGKSLEELINSLALSTQDFMQETRQTHTQMSTAIKSLENQVGQIAASLSQREPGKFPSQVIPNPNGGHETAKVITLRSGKEVERVDNEEINSTKTVAALSPKLTVPSDNSKVSSLVNHSITSKVPFPHRFLNSKNDQVSKDILETFRKVQVNIPLLDAIQQIPSYAKFLKELCKNKRKFKEHETVALSEEVSAMLLRKLPPKPKDPGSFTIPCLIGNQRFEHALLDLGRPFMRTTRTKIDVYEGTLTMAFDEETVEFKVFDALKYPNDDHACFSIDVLEQMVQETFNASQGETPLERALIQSPKTVNKEGINQARGAHDLPFPNQEFLWVQQGLLNIVSGTMRSEECGSGVPPYYFETVSFINNAPRVLGTPEPCGARNAAQADQRSLEACEDYGLNRSGISRACKDCDSSRLGVFEACEDGIVSVIGMETFGKRASYRGDSAEFSVPA